MTGHQDIIALIVMSFVTLLSGLFYTDCLMSHKKGLLLCLHYHYHQPAFLEATGYLLDNLSRPSGAVIDILSRIQNKL